MAARRSAVVEAALRYVKEGMSLSEAARRTGCNVRSVRRALRVEEQKCTTPLAEKLRFEGNG
jgi:DNA-directed RNA polymerase specialized sigma24 family protein